MHGWNDTRRTFRIAGASAMRRMERHHESADDDATRSDAGTPRALTEREVAERLGLSVATLRAWNIEAKDRGSCASVARCDTCLGRGGLRSGERC
jgi:hypothetical protein